MTSDLGDIAIIGMAGLYPDADDVDVFWQNILAQHDAVRDAPDDWLAGADLYDPESSELLKIYTTRGGFLGDLSRFRPSDFQTMPTSISGAQPDQFLALKMCKDALEDAGYPAGSADHQKTGVILGHSLHIHRANTNGLQQIWFDAQLRSLLTSILPEADPDRVAEAVELIRGDLPKLTADSVPGLVPNVMTGRIANRLDLMGPNYIIDAACSSSLISVDLAMSELRSGRADLMLAGGVNTTTSPLVYNVFCSVDALSRTGQIRPFSSNAGGTVLGEGVGALVLKRLEDALRDDDDVYAVVKGTGQSSDGKSTGLMAPRLEGEVLAMRRAYENADIDPQTIGLIEAHGTGIPLGDGTEIEAMRQIFGERGKTGPTVPIGSVKSMIGHCIPAAGSASLIKMALSLRHKMIPPTLCPEVSEDLGIEATNLYVSTECRPWINSSETPRRAGINAFGFGGINAHVILEESPQGRFPDPTTAFLPRPGRTASPAPAVVVFRAAKQADLIAQIDQSVTHVSAEGADVGEIANQSWDIAKNGEGSLRLAIVANGADDLIKKLSQAKREIEEKDARTLRTRNGIFYEQQREGGKIAFLFPGEMAQYQGMFAEGAMQMPGVRQWFDDVAQISAGKRAVRLQDVVFPPPSTLSAAETERLGDLLHSVDYGSEMVFAADQAAFGLLTSMGIRPDSMLGHSTGENAAIVASGWVGQDRAEVCNVIGRMYEIFNDVNDSGLVPQGALLTVASLDRDTFDTLLEKHASLHFTMDNCPNQYIVFGDAGDIAAFEEEAKAGGAVCSHLPISWGYHTDFVTPMADRFADLFANLSIKATETQLYSCATASKFPKTKKKFLETARQQYVSRVRFQDAVQQLYADGHRIFIESGPNGTLTSFVKDILSDESHVALASDSARHGLLVQIRHVVAQLFALGRLETLPDALTIQTTEKSKQRAEKRAKQRTAPALPSALPFVELTADKIGNVRELLGLDRTASMPSPSVARPATSDVLQAHISTMSQFIRSSENVVLSGLNTDASCRNPDQIAFADLSKHFDVPFAYRAYVMSGNPPVDSLKNYLTDVELVEAEEIGKNARNATRWRDWSLGRLAVKRAVRDLLGARSQSVAERDLKIQKTELGAPWVSAAGQHDSLAGISVAHSGGAAVGIAAEKPWRVGIDFEQLGRVRDPGAFLEYISAQNEWSATAASPSDELATLVWSVKEAASKALGTGLQGQPKAFQIVEMDAAGGMARVAHGGRTVDIQFNRMGPGVCAVAYFEEA